MTCAATPAGLLLASLLAGGCAMGPRFKTPVVDAPGGFLGQGVVSQQMTLADLPWWTVFEDDTLHELVRTALTNNYDLRIAVKRVEEYQALSWFGPHSPIIMTCALPSSASRNTRRWRPSRAPSFSRRSVTRATWNAVAMRLPAIP